MDPSILFAIVQQKNITKQINNQLVTFCQKFTHGECGYKAETQRNWRGLAQAVEHVV